MNKFIKLTALILFCMSSGLNLFAQEGAFIGARIIPQTTWILNNDDFDNPNVDLKYTWGVAFAVAGGYNFNAKHGIEIQTLYSNQSQQYVDENNNKVATKNNIYYKIPLLYRFRTEGKLGSILTVGPQFGFLSRSDIDNHGVGSNVDDARNFYENFELSIALGFGASWMLSEKVSLDLMLKLDYGVTEIESGLGKAFFYDHNNDGRGATNNATGGFSVGVNYFFGSAE